MTFYSAKKSQIVMLGGRRSGKSSILASIVDTLKKQTRSDLFTVADAESINESGGMDIPLTDKIRELKSFIKGHKNPKEEFVVDMTPNRGRTLYKIHTRINSSANWSLDFLDVPGEDMQKTITINGKEEQNPHYSELMEKVKNSDVIVIAIDTPYLMYNDDDVNDVYNRIDEITSLTNSMKSENDKDSRLILLCPVKCEKWVLEGKAGEVSRRVMSAYRNLINTHVKNSCFNVWIMPIITAGGIQFCEMLDGYRFYEDENDEIGEVGSVNDLTGQVMKRNGELLYLDENNIEKKPDKSLYISHTQIPLSWYKTNGLGFKTKLCEQPAYHIIKFIANKAYINRTMSFWDRLKDFFGAYLNDYLELVKRLDKEKLIMYYDEKNFEENGFIQLKELVS